MNTDVIRESINSLNVQRVRESLLTQKEKGLDAEQIRAYLERTIRSKALTFVSDKIPATKINAFLEFVIELAKSETYLRTLTVTVMQDVFDISTIERCEKIFSVVENNIHVWKTPYFFEPCKNLILRMCNDLLKRLSRTIDTNFCGRILILLARSLPLNERSGLNLPGQFNVTNLTTYDKEERDDSYQLGADNVAQVDTKIEEEADMEVGEIREPNREPSIPGMDGMMGAVPFDYHLYTKFWEIQRFFTNPNLLFDSFNFKQFQEKLSEVLNVFSTYKLERPQKESTSRSTSRAPAILYETGNDANGIKLEYEEHKLMTDENENNEIMYQKLDIEINNYSTIKTDGGISKSNNQKCPVNFERMEVDGTDVQQNTSKASLDTDFFAKYLTGQKLFPLQLADSQFRRYFLCQCLIIGNYLTSKNKHRDVTTSLAISQDEYIRDTMEKCHALLKETYPNGSNFVEAIRKILSREKLWAAWKSDNCPDLVADLVNEKTQRFRRRDIGRYNPKVIDLGNKELTRLWSVSPDNLAACKDEKRNWVPSLKKFVKDALDEFDPDQEVEEQYLSVNDEKYQWWASRFLLFNSDQYISMEQRTAPTTPSYSTSASLKRAIFSTADITVELGLQQRSDEVQKQIKKRDEKIAAERAHLAAEEAQKLAKAKKEHEIMESTPIKQEETEPPAKKQILHQKSAEEVGAEEQKKPAPNAEHKKSMEEEERRMRRKLEERANKVSAPDELDRNKPKRPIIDGDVSKISISTTSKTESKPNETISPKRQAQTSSSGSTKINAPQATSSASVTKSSSISTAAVMKEPREREITTSGVRERAKAPSSASDKPLKKISTESTNVNNNERRNPPIDDVVRRISSTNERQSNGGHNSGKDGQSSSLSMKSSSKVTSTSSGFGASGRRRTADHESDRTRSDQTRLSNGRSKSKSPPTPKSASSTRGHHGSSGNRSSSTRRGGGSSKKEGGSPGASGKDDKAQSSSTSSTHHHPPSKRSAGVSDTATTPPPKVPKTATKPRA